MSGDGHGQGSDDDPPSGAASLADAIVLDQARGAPGLEARTAAYLDEQTRFLRLQAAHLHQQHALDLTHLRHRRWTDRLGLALQALAIAAGLGVATLIGIAAWDAAHDRDLVIAPFSAAPELAARGATGSVLAAHLLDRLTALQDETDSLRATSSYRDIEPTDIKVEPADTGLSLGEVRRYMVELLGRETRISGDAVRTPDGRLAVTARVGDRPGQTFRGADADLDHMVDLSAEQVFCATQAYRCAVHMDREGRSAEALAVLDRLGRTGTGADRSWALATATAIQTELGDIPSAIASARRGLAVDPNFLMLHWNLAPPYARRGWAEAQLGELHATARLLQHEQPDLDPARLAELRQAVASDLAAALGDYQSALQADDAAASRAVGEEIPQAAMRRLRDAIGLHDRSAEDAALGALARHPPSARMMDRGGAVSVAANRLILALDRGDQTALPAAINAVQTALAANPASGALRGRNALALVRAQIAVGDVAGASATLAAAPADCYFCAIARGELARAQGDAHAADTWFIRASQLGPSLPFADEAWGRVELARGHLSVAPGRFASAAHRAPRWADPQKGWGDVLARQGRWQDALEHYDAALKLAPNWPELRQARATAAAQTR